MKYDLQLLEKYVNEGLITKNKHPRFDIYIYNYSRKTQYESLWDEVTLSCRGLILDSEGNILARPFKKFFNYFELDDSEKERISNLQVKGIFEKCDGSLAIIFNYAGLWIVSTRGSFESEQAAKGQEIFNSKINYTELNKDYTYLAEIVYKDNQIVVDYKDMEELFLLGVVDNETGKELSILNYNYKVLGFQLPEYFGQKNLVEFQKFFAEEIQTRSNFEGVIVVFEDNTRVKFKTEEYIKLYKIINGLSNRIILDAIISGDIDSIIIGIPEEIRPDYVKIKEAFLEEFLTIKEDCISLFNQFKHLEPKKEFALAVKGHQYASILFKLYDKQDESQTIWNVVIKRHF